MARRTTPAQIDFESAYELGSCGCCGPYPAHMYSPVWEMNARLKYRRRKGRKAEKRTYKSDLPLRYFRLKRGRRSNLGTVQRVPWADDLPVDNGERKERVE